MQSDNISISKIYSTIKHIISAAVKRSLLTVTETYLARPAELESTTFWSVARRSIQLSYERICLSTEAKRFRQKWRKEWDSNPRMAHTIAGFQDRCLKPTRPSFHAKHNVDYSKQPLFCQPCF